MYRVLFIAYSSRRALYLRSDILAVKQSNPSLVPSLFQDMGDEEESGERASHYLEHWNVIGVTCGVVIERNCVNWLL